MSALNELDTSYLKSINALHTRDHLHNIKPSLQTYLEEAIKSKTGKEVNLTTMVQSLMKQSGVEMIKIMDDTKEVTTSDNELDLDMFLKEDLACVVCQGMDVGARNRLLECSDCHALYHQDCHQPPVSQQDADNTWNCTNCKEVKKAKKSPAQVVSSSSSSSHVSSKQKSSSSSNSPRHSGDRSDRSSSSSGYKSSSSSSKSGSKSSSSSSSGSKSSSSSSSKSSSSKHPPVTTSSSIVSADKRLQNMKKKAAKLHEKKKLPR